jgi:NADPH-dependent 2,4-dienoyl-CoA reductase/sulfur reductase-like enzyme
VQCAVNPWCGREKELEIKSAPKKKKVMVVGGGAAGMQAAWVAAKRGHEVSLYEKSNQLGGQMLLTSMPPGRDDWNVFTRHQMNQVAKTGVKVITGREVNQGLISKVKPHVLIMATGSIPTKPKISGIDGSNCVQARDVLRGRAKCRGSIIVVGGGLVGCGVAEWLAEKGHKVRIVEMQMDIAPDMFLNEKTTMLERWKKLDIEVFTGKKVVSITARGINVEEDGKTGEIDGETIVLAMGAESDQKLAGVKEKIREFFPIGDCAKPRKIMDAVYEGTKVACEI